MNKSIVFACSLFFSSFSSATTLTLVNNLASGFLPQPLFVRVLSGATNVPNFSGSFILLEHGSNRQTNFVTSQNLPGCSSPPYDNPTVRINIKKLDGSSAYFGVGFDCKMGTSTDALRVSGFQSLGIAYSWENGVDAKVYFCSPDDYQKHNSCNW